MKPVLVLSSLTEGHNKIGFTQLGSIYTNANKQKSKVKGSKKHETYTQGRLTVHLTKGTRIDRKSTRLNSSHKRSSRMPSSA